MQYTALPRTSPRCLIYARALIFGYAPRSRRSWTDGLEGLGAGAELWRDKTRPKWIGQDRSWTPPLHVESAMCKITFPFSHPGRKSHRPCAFPVGSALAAWENRGETETWRSTRPETLRVLRNTGSGLQSIKYSIVGTFFGFRTSAQFFLFCPRPDGGGVARTPFHSCSFFFQGLGPQASAGRHRRPLAAPMALHEMRPAPGVAANARRRVLRAEKVLRWAPKGDPG